MPNPKLTIEEVSAGKNLQALETKLHDIIVEDQVEPALWFYRNLTAVSQQPAAQTGTYRIAGNQCQSIAARAGWVALPLLTDTEVLALCRDKLKVGLQLTDVNLEEKFRGKLLTFALHDQRDTYKEQVRKVIITNQETLTASMIIGDQSVRGSCSEWIKEYARIFGDGTIDSVKFSQFFTSNKNATQLTAGERLMIERLFRLYAKLLVSSESIEGVEETIPIDDPGREGVIRDGKYEKLKEADFKRDLEIAKRIINLRTLDIQPAGSTPTASLPPSAPDPLLRLQQQYEAYRRGRQAVLRLEDELLVRTAGALEAIKRELSAAVRTKEKFRVIACLKLLAREGELQKSLKESQSWLVAVSEYLQRKYVKVASPDDLRVAINNVKSNPTTPAVISEFLQYLLREQCAMNENESALVGVEIGQLIGTDFQGLAYGNEETGTFEWVKNKIINRQLVSELG